MAYKNFIFSVFMLSLIIFNYTISMEPNEGNIDYLTKLEQLKEAERKNNLASRIATATGEELLKGGIQAGANIISQSVVEMVKRELDLLYDDRLTTSATLQEILQGLQIINTGINATMALPDKITQLDQLRHESDPLKLSENEKKAIAIKAKKELLELQELREEHIQQLKQIRQKRNSNFKPKY